MAASDQYTLKSRTNTRMTDRSKASIFSRISIYLTEKMTLKPALKHRASVPRTYHNPDTGVSQPLPPGDDDDDDDGMLQGRNKVKVEDKHRDFSFGKLRRVHNLAEKVNEALLMLKQNVLVLSEGYYGSISNRKYFPKDLKKACEDAIDDMKLRMDGLGNELQTQVLRLETMLRLLDDRKILVISIVQFRIICKTKNRLAPQHFGLPKFSSEHAFNEQYVYNDRRHERYSSQNEDRNRLREGHYACDLILSTWNLHICRSRISVGKLRPV